MQAAAKRAARNFLLSLAERRPGVRGVHSRDLESMNAAVLAYLGMSAAIAASYWHWPKELQAPAARVGRMGRGL